MQRFLEPTQEAGRAFWMRGIPGKAVMLNLVRLHQVADFAAHPALAPAQPISGAEAYDRDIAHTLPLLTQNGGAVLFLGEGGPFLIGPADERRDNAMLVKHSSVQAFMAFAGPEGYLVGFGHRTAAVEGLRLLPLVEHPVPVISPGSATSAPEQNVDRGHCLRRAGAFGGSKSRSGDRGADGRGPRRAEPGAARRRCHHGQELVRGTRQCRAAG
jgi:hypothetical protein